MRPSQPIPPLVKNVRVPWAPEAAFRRFTEEMAAWWPLRSHSVAEDNAAGCGIEGRVGGKVYEVDRQGKRCEWGTVLAWEPPSRVAFTWHPGQDPATAQEIDLRFLPDGSGTRLQLTHTGWEKLGPKARRYRKGYGLGWSYVLSLWAGRRGPLVWTLDAIGAIVRLLRRRGAQRELAPSPAQTRRTAPTGR